MRKWTQDEIGVLKEYYPIKGSKHCAVLLHRSRKAIVAKAHLLKLNILEKWTQDEDNLLKQYYQKRGGKYCANLLGRTHASTLERVRKIGLAKTTMKWSSQEDNVLIEHYYDKGGIGCARLLKRTSIAVKSRANKIGLLARTTLGSVPSKKHIIEKLSETRGTVRCEKHGCVLHYLSHFRPPSCTMCIEEYNKEYRKKNPITLSQRLRINQIQRERYQKPIYNYANRLRRLLRFYSHGEISFSKHLPYSGQQLCDHLENIKKQQDNKCPMCHISYGITGYDIDHVLPISIATNKEEIFKLFALDNLSLLCPSCNRHIKRDIDAKKYKENVIKCL